MDKFSIDRLKKGGSPEQELRFRADVNCRKAKLKAETYDLIRGASGPLHSGMIRTEKLKGQCH